MKRMLSFGAVAFACCLLLAQPSRAAVDIQVNPSVGNVVEFYPTSPGGGNGGGPFLGKIGADTWRTFCVEADGGLETINLEPTGTVYKVRSISANVAAATGNVVTQAAKFLYYAYGHGMLTGSVPTYTDTSANNTALQLAICSLVIKRAPTAPINPVGN